MRRPPFSRVKHSTFGIKTKDKKGANMTQKKVVGVICGGPSHEHQVSLISAQNIAKALVQSNYDVVLFAIDHEGQWHCDTANRLFQQSGDIGSIAINLQSPVVFLQRGGVVLNAQTFQQVAQVDLCFPIAHGLYGEDGTLQGFLRILAIPCVGADHYGSAICMDKDITKNILKIHGLPVTESRCLRHPEEASFEELSQQLGLPLFVKPCRSGSSVGVSKVTDAQTFNRALADAFVHSPKVLVEAAIIGQEVECAVLGNRYPQAASVLGEIRPINDFYSYKAKYLSQNGAELKVPAEVSLEIQTQIIEMSVKAFIVLECQGMARVDFFVSDQCQIIINEINTLPGFTSISMYPKLWEASGISQSELCHRLVDLALQRHQEDQGYQSCGH